MGRVRINLIPFNMVGASLHGSDDKVVKNWHDILMKKGFIATIRRSQGADIAAACGQLGLRLGESSGSERFEIIKKII